jgi:hypothetical protein
VKTRLEELIRGRFLVGYLIHNKLEMLGIQFSVEEYEKVLDVSRIFNKTMAE